MKFGGVDQYFNGGLKAWEGTRDCKILRMIRIRH